MFMHGSFKMAKDIFAKVEFVEICVEYMYKLVVIQQVTCCSQTLVT
jgi:hypothetical protein